MKEIPLSVPNLNIEIADSLRECIETGWVSTGGAFITAFEDKIASYVGVDEAVGCQSGTAGLHTALRMLGVGAGDIVICPTLTFIAAVNPVRYLDAAPVFIGCGADLCMDPAALERYLREDCHAEKGLRADTGNINAMSASPGDAEPVREEAKAYSRVADSADSNQVIDSADSNQVIDNADSSQIIDNATGRPVKAIVVVHVFGVIADMARIMDVAAAYGLPVLEDATEAMGSFVRSGRYDGRHAGTIGDIGVFSFNANKIITTGGGGMIVASGGSGADAPARARNDLEEARYLTTTAKDDGIYFAHGAVGYNYRMLNLQAALGVSQIDELEHFVEIKQRNYALYRELLAEAPGLTVLPPPDGQRWNHWFYSLYIEDDARRDVAGCRIKSGMTEGLREESACARCDTAEGARRDRVMRALIEDGIQCRPVWKLVHTQTPYKEFRALDTAQACNYEKHILNPPCSTSLGEDDVRYVCSKILEYVR
jgi:dTDP-4-amino-4,6-dideoxygalactose transaminase